MAAAGALLALAGCTSVSSNHRGDALHARSDAILVCHGFDCRHRTQLDITPARAERFAAAMSGHRTAEAERAAIARAVMTFETMATERLGVADEARSSLSQTGRHGQMDCIDESTNTRSLLLYLQGEGLLRHHEVSANVTRGFLLDRRYFHATAVLGEKGGTRWAVDSWYEPAGGPPDIMPLEDWLRRGVMGDR